MKNMVTVMKYTCLTLLWCLAVYGMVTQFFAKAVPLYENRLINDGTGKTTRQLHPKDMIEQKFLIIDDNVESVSIAFDYEDSAADVGEVAVRFFYQGSLVAEQPLPLIACPRRVFLEFHLGLQQCKGESLTLQIVNVSEDEAGLFSLLETKNIYAYSEYSDGYLFNGVYGEEGSILCNFKFMTGKHYYMGLTYAFWVLILSLLCTHFILRGFAWLQRRTCR